MRKYLSLALALAMLVSASALAACGDDATDTEAPAQSSTPVSSNDTATTTTPEAENTTTPDEGDTTDPEGTEGTENPTTPNQGGDETGDPFEALFHEYNEVENLDAFKGENTNLYDEGYFDNMVAELSIYSGYDYTESEDIPEAGSNEGAQNLFDMNENTKWCAPANTVEGASAIVWQMTEAVTVKGYTITTANDNATYKGRNPVRWRLYAATELPTVRMDEVVNEETGETYFDLQYDGVVPEGWTLIDGVNAEDPLDPTQSQIPDINFTEFGYEVANPGTYQYFMLLIDYCANGGTMQIADFTLYGSAN